MIERADATTRRVDRSPRRAWFRCAIRLATVASMVVAGLSMVAVPADAAPVAAGAPSSYVPVGPVRLADTREVDCGCTRSSDATVRVQVTGRDGVPVGATAAALTVTAVARDRSAFVTVWPAGGVRPTTSVVNVGPGAVAANSTIVPLSADGAVELWSNTATDLVIDVSGAFVPASAATAGRFTTFGPERLLDTRTATALVAGERRVVPRPAGVPADATAWVVNITSVGASGAGFVTAFAAGGAVPSSSILNPDGSSAPVAASTVVPASADGIEFLATVATDLVVDVTGWFTGPSAASSADGLFVPTTPMRLLDTRTDGPRLWGAGDREVAVDIPGAAAVVTNLTIVQPDASVFVTARAAGTPLPPTSNLNAPHRGAVVANSAITARSDRGLSWYSNTGTDLAVDMTGWFTGSPATATEPAIPNLPRPVGTLLIGDSTLAALDVVTASQRALQGASHVLDAAPCRRLVKPSCRSAFTNRVPSTAVEAIRSAAQAPRVLVVKAGYNEGSAGFRDSVVAVLTAARARRVEVVVWLTYSEGTGSQLRTYALNNAVLTELRDSGDWPELELADWRTYAASSSGWYSGDRVHLQGTGAWATADYITRWVAHVVHAPCPQPWAPGEVLDDPCPNPDTIAAQRGTPALRSLYGF